MDFLNALNPEQREAVLHRDGPLLILAGAGSGKTRVIAFRVAYLVGSGIADASEVLAVTFTNKAAEEMRERVESLLGSSCGRLWVSTFHAFCARILRREAGAIGLRRDFVIYDTSDQLSVVKRVLKDLQIDESFLQPRAALSRISQCKNRMESPAAVIAGGSYRDERFAGVYQAYTDALASSGALDFDDLLLCTVDLFEKSDPVRHRYSRQFRFIMVDEYQDTNRPQYLLRTRLAEVHRNLAVVGDPDQSIYKWRGADIRNILDFEQDFPEALVVRLERNYRSTQIILDAASAVISRNLNRKEKRLWTERKGGDRIVYARCGDELEEADFIARSAREVLRSGPDATSAVLYRTNAQSRVLEDALRRANLEYRIIGGVRFYERKEVKDTLAYLRLLLNPNDDVSLRRVINVPSRGIGKTVMDALEESAADRSDAAGNRDLPPLLAGLAPEPGSPSLWAGLVRGLESGRFTSRARASLAAFRDLVVGLSDIATREPVSVVIGKVLDQSGYVQDLREDRSEEADGRIENLSELVSAAREFEGRDPEPSLPAFVDRLSLLSDADESDGAKDARILLLTLHSAKGLEFPTVFITGLEEGLFPHSRSSDDEGELEEERRLCYVGMTRARNQLVLTSASRRRVFGEYRASEPSRFIDEVPDELVERVDFVGSGGYNGARGGMRSVSRVDPYARPPRPAAREAAPTYRYEDEDQTGGSLRPGMRVRHPQFGVGTVLEVEELHDDMKLSVRFASVGVKRLLAKFARLTPG
jgi:DNA helicase-2/ATP-dependent DNA helicase PcrA